MTRKRMATVGVLALAALAAAGVGGWWWASHRGVESTDNAFVQADTVQVSAQVAGYVAEVLVRDNQAVAPGQVLLRLDPAEAQARLAQAQAEVQALQAAARNVADRASAGQASIAERAAAIGAAQAQAGVAQAELDRYGRLAERGWVSGSRLQTVEANSAAARAGLAQAEAALEAERRSIGALGSTRAQTLAEADRARAQVTQARINLGRLEVRAPAAGVVGARAVRPGQYVQPGQALMAVVPLGRTFVTANFKETQIGAMRLGQPVEIRADAFPGHVFRGRIDSFAPATGSEFALIPVENASGNFTKVVQRIPVRIAVDASDPLSAGLRPGLSLHVSVDTRLGGGATFAEAAAAPVRSAAAR